MKKILLSTIIIFSAFLCNSQSLFLQGNFANSEHKFRQMVDFGIYIKNNKFSIYTESFVTQPDGHLRSGGYRKFFLGARYGRVMSVCNSFDIVPSLGIDIRLNGGNTVKTSAKGIYGTVANMPSARLGIAIEKKVIPHVKLSANVYSQLNAKENFGKYCRTGAGAGVVIVF